MTLPTDPKKISPGKIPVFVSSTKKDLMPYRKIILDFLEESDIFDPRGMEDFGSRSESSLETSLSELRECTIYLGIIGMRYGSVVENFGKSITQLEYETADEQRLEILLYLIDEDNARIAPKFADYENAMKLQKFKKILKDKHTVSYFTTPDDLKIRIEKDLERLLISRKDLRPRYPPITTSPNNISIAVVGTETYYQGEKIHLCGTSHSYKVYLFLTGPNLNLGGVKLDNPNIVSITNEPATFTGVTVGKDDVWDYVWDTSKLSKFLESGEYVIYAVPEPITKDQITDQDFATLLINIKNPFIIAHINSGIIAQGDELIITGFAEGNPSNVYVWIFGDEYKSLWNPVNVNKDGTFEYRIKYDQAMELPVGQYFIVVQHPMNDPIGSVMAKSAGSQSKYIFKNPQMPALGGSTELKDISNMGGSDAATLLVGYLNEPNVKDTYRKLTFLVENPWINIDTIEERKIGDIFSITGITNLAEKDEILVEILPIPNDLLKSASGLVLITKGDGYNSWSFDLDTSAFEAGEYRVSAKSLYLNAKAISSFKIIKSE